MLMKKWNLSISGGEIRTYILPDNVNREEAAQMITDHLNNEEGNDLFNYVYNGYSILQYEGPVKPGNEPCNEFWVEDGNSIRFDELYHAGKLECEGRYTDYGAGYEVLFYDAGKLKNLADADPVMQAKLLHLMLNSQDPSPKLPNRKRKNDIER